MIFIFYIILNMQWYEIIDILREIFGYLALKEIYIMMIVNKTFNKIAEPYKSILLKDLYSECNGDHAYLPCYVLLIHDPIIRGKLVDYLRNIVLNMSTITDLVILLRGNIFDRLIYTLPKPFFPVHVNYIINLIVKKYNLHNDLLFYSIIDRKVIYAYLYLIGKFDPQKIRKTHLMDLPDDFDFAL